MIRRFAILATCITLIACSPLARPAETTPIAESPASTLAATPVPLRAWVHASIPQSFSQPLKSALSVAGYEFTDYQDDASIRIAIEPMPNAILASTIILALVAPFPTTVDDVSWSDLRSYRQGTAVSLPGFDAPPRFVVSDDLAGSVELILGQDRRTFATTAGSLIDEAWNNRPTISIVPFDQLDPRWKVLSIDGQSPLDKHFDVDSYPLVIRVSALASEESRDQALRLLQPVWQTTNRDPSKITVVILTGTTALTRSTAWFIENKGADFPSLNIRPFFADKDILHVSNEVSFTPKCPPPDLNATEFCSKPEYFDVLKQIDVDIVELTGNHNNDYSIRPTFYTLDMYDQAGVPYYGGGRTVDEAKQPRTLVAPDGTRIAFVGCNSAGPFKAFATTETPGAAPCDDWAWIRQTIADLKSSGQADVVIATVQYHELQSYSPEKQQVPDFQALADAGADIVSGSQAHVPQGFAITPTSFIHYGVGNLFFDQMDFIENRQMFADKYIFYKGRLISVMLFTGIMEDYSQPRPMTPEERADFLKLIFEKSGW